MQMNASKHVVHIIINKILYQSHTSQLSPADHSVAVKVEAMLLSNT